MLALLIAAAFGLHVRRRSRQELAQASRRIPHPGSSFAPTGSSTASGSTQGPVSQAGPPRSPHGSGAPSNDAALSAPARQPEAHRSPPFAPHVRASGPERRSEPPPGIDRGPAGPGPCCAATRAVAGRALRPSRRASDPVSDPGRNGRVHAVDTLRSPAMERPPPRQQGCHGHQGPAAWLPGPSPSGHVSGVGALDRAAVVVPSRDPRGLLGHGPRLGHSMARALRLEPRSRRRRHRSTQRAGRTTLGEADRALPARHSRRRPMATPGLTWERGPAVNPSSFGGPDCRCVPSRTCRSCTQRRLAVWRLVDVDGLSCEQAAARIGLAARWVRVLVAHERDRQELELFRLDSIPTARVREFLKRELARDPEPPEPSSPIASACTRPTSTASSATSRREPVSVSAG